jgi:hypothetical protein
VTHVTHVTHFSIEGQPARAVEASIRQVRHSASCVIKQHQWLSTLRAFTRRFAPRFSKCLDTASRAFETPHFPHPRPFRASPHRARERRFACERQWLVPAPTRLTGGPLSLRRPKTTPRPRSRPPARLARRLARIHPSLRRRAGEIGASGHVLTCWAFAHSFGPVRCRALAHRANAGGTYKFKEHPCTGPRAFGSPKLSAPCQRRWSR